MSINKKLFFSICTLLLCCLVSCGESGDGNRQAGIDGTGSPATSVGSVEGFGSVIVNGVKFDTSRSAFIIDGQIGNEGQLALGQVVIVSGRINSDGFTGVADSVIFNTNMLGPIKYIDISTATLSVLSHTIVVDEKTVFSGFDSLLELNTGQLVSISGHNDAQGAVLATYIESHSGVGYEMTGNISDLDQDESTFMINDLLVDFSRILDANILQNGKLVEVVCNRLGLNEEMLAREVNILEIEPNESGKVLQLEGLVTRYMNEADFDVGDITAKVTNNTKYENGGVTDLVLNARVEVEGIFNETNQLVVERVIFSPLGPFTLNGVLGGITNESTQAILTRGFTPLSESSLSFVATNELTIFTDESSVGLAPFGLSDINVDTDYLGITGFVYGETPGSLTATRVVRKDSPIFDQLNIEGVALAFSVQGVPACDDGIDNDGDDGIDFSGDVDCLSATGSTEADPININNNLPDAVAYYDFDTVDWTAVDSEIKDLSGNDYHGDAFNLSSNDQVIGQEGQALSFNGSDAYIDLGIFDFSGSDVTIAMWAYFDSFSSCGVDHNCQLISKATGTDEQNHYWTVGTKKIYGETFFKFLLKAGSTTNSLLDTSTPLEEKRWYHIAAWYDGVDMKIYLNGQEVASKNNEGVISFSSGISVNLGRNSSGGISYLEGKLDEVRVFSKALSPKNIAIVSGLGSVVPTDTCKDGVDNDFDGLIDYPADSGCDSVDDIDEFNEDAIDISFTLLNYRIIVSDVGSVADLYGTNGESLTLTEFISSAANEIVRVEVDNPPLVHSPIKASRIYIME